MTPDRLVRAVAAMLALGLLGVGCSGEAESAALDRDTFIDVYIDLRTAALAAPDGRLPDERREEILARHEVTEEELLSFVEVHGRDVDYMKEVWSEVEARMDSLEAPTRTSG